MVISIRATLLLIAALITAVLWPDTTVAHGGVQQHVGDTHVTLIQKPLSPLVNESVRLSFVLTGVDDEPLRDFLVTMRILQTNDTNSGDEIVFTSNGQTDQNGVIEFQFAFPEERDYDISLDFAGAESEAGHTIGFLVSPRDVTLPDGYPTSRVFLAMGVGMLIGIGILQTARALRTP